MDELERLLETRGERWRDSQPSPPDLDRTAVDNAGWAPWLPSPVLTSAGVMALVAALGFVALQVGPWRESLGSLGNSGQPSGSPNAWTGSCEITRPTRGFVPPAGYLPSPPDSYGSEWFGSPELWTILRRHGEVWKESTLPRDNGRLVQKLFWWSAEWDPTSEPMPRIAVQGQQLDGSAAFEAGPGSNASADFGTAMLVGAEFPGPGCWRITGSYRASELSYVVLITGD